MDRIFESLYHTPETNVKLYVNYTGILFFFYTGIFKKETKVNLTLGHPDYPSSPSSNILSLSLPNFDFIFVNIHFFSIITVTVITNYLTLLLGHLASPKVRDKLSRKPQLLSITLVSDY